MTAARKPDFSDVHALARTQRERDMMHFAVLTMVLYCLDASTALRKKSTMICIGIWIAATIGTVFTSGGWHEFAQYMQSSISGVWIGISIGSDFIRSKLMEYEQQYERPDTADRREDHEA